MTSGREFSLTAKDKKIAISLMVLGVAALAYGFYQDPTRGWVNLFVNNIYFLSIGLAALFLMSVGYLSGACWWVGMRRVIESIMTIIPVSAFLMLGLYFGVKTIYPWARPEVAALDHVIHAKAGWYNVPFFFARMAVILAIWYGFAAMIRKVSLVQDRAPGPQSSEAVQSHRKLKKISAIFIPVFALTFTLATFEWMMSIEPRWYSTIYAIYNFSALFLHGTAVIALTVIVLRERGYLEGIVNENHTHDLAKIILAFGTFWVCMWVNQYMLIWYSNIPEEVTYFVLRLDRDWIWLFYLNIIVNWLVPFGILLIRKSKRSFPVLKRVCILLLVGHWIDLYVQLAPPILKTRSIGFVEVLTSLGYGALFVYVVGTALARRPLVAVNDLRLEESLHHHQ